MDNVVSGNFRGKRSSVPPAKSSMPGISRANGGKGLKGRGPVGGELLASGESIARYARSARKAVLSCYSFQEGKATEDAREALGKEGFGLLSSVGRENWGEYSKKEIIERLNAVSKDGHLRDDQKESIGRICRRIERICPEKLGGALSAEQINEGIDALEETAETVEQIHKNILSIESRIDEFAEIDARLSEKRGQLAKLSAVVSQLIGKADYTDDIKDPMLKAAVGAYMEELYKKPDLDRVEEMCENALQHMVNGKGELNLDPVKLAKDPKELAKLAIALSMRVELLVRATKLAELGKDVMKAIVRGDSAKPEEELQ
jgi:hypothetical protein